MKIPCKLSHTSSYILANNSSKFEECPKVELNNDVSMKNIFTRNVKKHFASIKINTIDVQTKFALEWQPFLGVITLT
jgi:hypothetical protein